MSVLVLYYSMYGHIYQLAQEIVKGVQEAGAKAALKRVPETLPEAVLQKMGALDFHKAQKNIPVCEDVMELPQYDAIIFGTPTRFGNMCGQMRQFLDATGKLWVKNSLVGKIGSVFSSSNTQHGGQESTILSFHITLLHQGMVIAGLPYTFAGQSNVDEITGCSPYGASTIAGPKGERSPTENEKAGARFQGKYVAGMALKLSAK